MICYHQEESLESNVESIRMEVLIKQLKAAEEYYLTNTKVDQHNRNGQSGVRVEKKILTRDWSKLINDSILLICFLDAYLLAKGCRTKPVKMRDFFSSWQSS